MARKRRNIITITTIADSNTQPSRQPKQTRLSKRKELDYTAVFGDTPDTAQEKIVLDTRNDHEERQMGAVRPKLIQESDINELQESIQSAFSASNSALSSPPRQRQQENDGLGFDDILKDFSMEDASEKEVEEQKQTDEHDGSGTLPPTSPGRSITSSGSRSSKKREVLRDVDEIVKDLSHLAGKNTKTKSSRGSLRYCTDRNEYYRKAEDAADAVVPPSTPESCTSSASRSSKKREKRLRDFNDIVKDLTLAGKKKNENTSGSRRYCTDPNEHNREKEEDVSKCEEEKHEQHDDGATSLESEGDENSLTVYSTAHPDFENITIDPAVSSQANQMEETRAPSLLDPCFCGNELAMQTIQNLQETYGVEFGFNAQELKENFVNDLEMDRLVTDMQDLQKDISALDMAEMLQKLSIPAVENPCPESTNQRLLLAIAESHECGTSQSPKPPPPLVPEPPVQSSFSCIPEADDDVLGDEEEGLEIPYMSCHEEKGVNPNRATNKKKTFFGFLSSSQKSKNRPSSPEAKPEVMRLKLNDGTMATVSKDTASKLRTCNWV